MNCLACALSLLFFLFAAPAPAADASGFIHGTVVLREGGEHTGFLRWKDEEAFWDDLFHSQQHELEWFDYVDMEALKAERKRRYYATHGMLDRVIWSLSEGDSDLHPWRGFVMRFGDLAALRIDEDDDVTAIMRDGREVTIGGYSNDVSGDIIVHGDGEPVELEWDELSEIRFAPAPEGALPYADRLYGQVEFRGGTFRGSIQWDKSECTSIDILDSSSEDLPVGRVRSLARSDRGGSDVVLVDGTTLHMWGTNDVGSGNRGAMVEVPGLGRVTVPWKRFVRAAFESAPTSGPGYADFAAPRPLHGVVTDREGRRHEGRIVYDLDEAWTTDILNGVHQECDYDIPFGLVREIIPGENDSCQVIMADGRRLTLSDEQDTGHNHAGVLVFVPEEEEPLYLPWHEVARLVFSP